MSGMGKGDHRQDTSGERRGLEMNKFNTRAKCHNSKPLGIRSTWSDLLIDKVSWCRPKRAYSQLKITATHAYVKDKVFEVKNSAGPKWYVLS